MHEYCNGSDEKLNINRETSGVEVESDGNTIWGIVNKLNTDWRTKTKKALAMSQKETFKE